MKSKMISACRLALMLASLSFAMLNVGLVMGWSNGGFSEDPSNPDYGTHDWIAQHALDWLPTYEKQYILDNLAAYLYGTELPDNGRVPDGIGDTTKHHIYYWSNGSLQDDASAVRASKEFHNALDFLRSGNFTAAAKTAGIMSHYIVDVAVFGHVMGAGTDWGSETHHSEYESYVGRRTSSYEDEFNVYLSFDGELRNISAYDAANELAYDTTFDVDGDLTCVWMDENYNWSDPTFRNRAGESINLAVNYLADVLHTLYLAAPHNIQITFVNASKTILGQGYSLDITVTILNQGVFTENSNLTVYANTTAIASKNFTLTSGNSATMALTWNTTGVTYGNYTISAYAFPVLGETELTDNTLTNGVVLVTVPGDVNGDRIVDIYDIGVISAHWYLGPPQGPLGYDSNADVNGDGAVDIFDIGIASAHWGQSW